MDRYGDELEADFQQVWHLDLGELVRQGKIRRIVNLIDQLPQACRFYSAVANDEEHVKAIIEKQGDQPESKGPSLAEWNGQSEALAAVVDGLHMVVAAVIASQGGKPPTMKPYQRPTTAFEDMRQLVHEERHKSLAARVLRRSAQVE